MNREGNKKNQPNTGKLIGLALVLLVTMPQFAVILGIIVGIIYVIRKAAQSKSQSGQKVFEQPKFGQPKFEQPRFEQPKFEQPSFENGKRFNFDDCPQSMFCFHKDKGEHYVGRGKEIDPWDRPDIDIRKYQRKG